MGGYLWPQTRSKDVRDSAAANARTKTQAASAIYAGLERYRANASIALVVVIEVALTRPVLTQVPARPLLLTGTDVPLEGVPICHLESLQQPRPSMNDWGQIAMGLAFDGWNNQTQPQASWTDWALPIISDG
jgi:hypothetical protein